MSEAKRKPEIEVLLLSTEETEAAIYEGKVKKWFKINRGLEGDKEADEWRQRQALIQSIIKNR